MCTVRLIGQLNARRRLRRISPEPLLSQAVTVVLQTAKPLLASFHGGTVAHSYKYRADADAMVVAAFPQDGEVYAVGWVAVVSASASHARAAGACLRQAQDYFDDRLGLQRRHASFEACLLAARNVFQAERSHTADQLITRRAAEIAYPLRSLVLWQEEV